MIENRESDDERACCLLSLSLSLFLVLCFSFQFLLLFVRKKKTREKSNEQTKIVPPFFFFPPPQKFHRAHTTRITRITHTHIHIVRLWFRKEEGE